MNAGLGTPYWYEWEVGLLECLKMMSNKDVESVTLQSSDLQCLDDVVIRYSDNSIASIQVKHTDVENSFTYSTLTSGTPSMLRKWCEEWQREKENYSFKEIRIVTNREWGSRGSGGRCSFSNFITKVLPKIKKDFNYQGESSAEIKAVEWLKTQLEFLEDEAQEFVKIWNFYQEEDLQGVDLKIKNEIEHILGTTNKVAVDRVYKNLLARLNVWATSKREKQEITTEELYNTLSTTSITIPRYELFPEKPIFPSRKRFAEKIEILLTESQKKIILLEGMPGSGKTNFVSYLTQRENSLVDFRFYTYLPVNKDYPTFSDDEGYYSGKLLWESLLTQIRNKFYEQGMLYKLQFPLVYDFLPISEIRALVLKYLPLYAKELGRTCYIFIDGLDHAARSNNTKDSFLQQLPSPEEIGEGIKFIFVSQPINDKFPFWMNNNPKIEYVQLPLLEVDDISMLLSEKDFNTNGIDEAVLSQCIMDVVGSNTLNVLFAINEVARVSTDLSFDEIIDRLKERKLNCQIGKYYEWILSAIEDNVLLLKLKIIFGFASQKILLDDIASMCGVGKEDVVFILNKLYPLIVNEDDAYYVFHNDIRLFLKTSMASNSNFEAMVLAIRANIKENNSLGKYNYDILFGSLSEMTDKSVLLNYISSEYIIKSVQYDVPVDKLIKQFKFITKLVLEGGNLTYINKVSLIATTIYQYINCLQYHEKEVLLEENIAKSKTNSEKYILNPENDKETIISDIYALLRKQQFMRAEKVFDEYFNHCSLEKLLADENSNYDRSYFEKCGFVYRCFVHKIKLERIDETTENYFWITKGWLEASSAFCSIEAIEKTFSIYRYDIRELLKYTEHIGEINGLDKDSFALLIDIYLTNEFPICSLIELCIKGILENYDVQLLKNAIFSRKNELLETKEIEFNKEIITYFIKLYFCVFEIIDDEEDFVELYLKLLIKNHIDDNDRGYKPAIAQFGLAKTAFEYYYSDEIVDGEEIEYIYDIVFIGNTYGAGSCMDCDAYKVKDFLLHVIFMTHKNCDDMAALQLICDGIKAMFVWENPIYVTKLAPLYYLAEEKESFLEIVERWCGKSGVLWTQPYSEIEYIGKNIIQVLRDFKLDEYANYIELLIKYKIFSYVDHKDYSLKGVLSYYKELPLTPEKLMEYGMKILKLSDNARNIGDNRIAGDVDSAVFETAMDLGIEYVATLFELKNTPKEFYYWRECLLESYYNKFKQLDLDDNELVALLNLVNAWICVEIEETKPYGYNKIKYLKNFNYKIINSINDDILKESLLNTYANEADVDEIQSKNNEYLGYEELVNKILANGYSDEIENEIVKVLALAPYGQANFLLSLEAKIKDTEKVRFVSNCVIPYILENHKYSFSGTGVKWLIDCYAQFFNTEEWMQLYESIALKVEVATTEDFYGISDDLESIALNYIKVNNSDLIEPAFVDSIEMHENIQTACGMVIQDDYSPNLLHEINSLTAFVEMELGI